MKRCIIPALLAILGASGCDDIQKKIVDECVQRQSPSFGVQGANIFCGCIAERQQRASDPSNSVHQANDTAECRALATTDNTSVTVTPLNMSAAP